MKFNQADTHPSWHQILDHSLSKVDKNYLITLSQNSNWLPGPYKIFNAFKQPFSQVKFIMMGESPYPRPESANGYSFWDSRVNELWSPNGLSKMVNRTTSLRHFIKMLLVADNKLNIKDTSQIAISHIDKKGLVSTSNELFQNMLKKGFLLLNASLVLSERPVQVDATAWRPFINSILDSIYEKNPQSSLILLGKIAYQLSTKNLKRFNTLISEHPYNNSFISNSDVINFFKPLMLLRTKT